MKNTMKMILFVGALSLALTQANQKKPTDERLMKPDSPVKETPDNTIVRFDTMTEEINEIRYDKYAVTSSLSDFPTLNPVVVHFAISLILVAALLQMLNVFLFKKDIAWIVFLLIVAGFIAAVISIRNFQPQTAGLAERAAIIVKMHEEWAEWTVRTSFLALILQSVYLFITRFEKQAINYLGNAGDFICKRNRALMILIGIIMLSSAICVAWAGHLGTRLVHIEGAKPSIYMTPAFMNI